MAEQVEAAALSPADTRPSPRQHPLGLGLIVEAAAGHVVAAPLPRGRREVALDRLRERAGPGVLEKDTWAD